MNPKLIGGILGLLALGLVGYFAFANIASKSPKTSAPAEINYDFGDAPDGKQTSYEESFAQIGQFPSLLSSDGARTKKTDEVWLGQEVTSEIDAREVNVDEADDGISGTATSCKQSTTYFFIRIKNPG